MNSYSLNADGPAPLKLAKVAVGSSGDAFLGPNVSSEDVNGCEIYFGVRTPALSGAGVWINPQGVINPTSSPTGNPISPGGFIRVYGSGLGSEFYYRDTALRGVLSNILRVPLAATVLRVPTIGQNGIGFAMLQHAHYTQVMPDHPAVASEPILIYLTGVGAVNPPIADGTGDTLNPLITTGAQPTVLIGGFPATVLFSGLTLYPGLYQINVTMPPVPPSAISLPLAINVQRLPRSGGHPGSA